MIQNDFNLKITIMTIWHEHLDLIIGSQLWKKIPVDQSESLYKTHSQKKSNIINK